jgi:L-fucose mutarotase
MLKGIPKILPPELLKVLCEMGHGDRLVIADGNFPSASVGKNAVVIRMDGHGVPEVLEAVLQLFPLDTYVEKPVCLMDLSDRDKGKLETPIWRRYEELIAQADDRGARAVGYMERFAFYEAARTAYAVIATSESALYANILLQKGVI